ncbi:MAG: endolytic transglycosylase MltG [Elusimicrobiota bacterium]|nr:endolytic transglycosylase MltG [Elusimicrobiota bacterium]
MIKKILVTGFTFLLLLGVYFFWQGKPVKITIEKGSSAGQVAYILKKKGVIINAFWFKALVKISNTGRKIMPGEYEFKKHTSAEEVLWILIHSTYSEDIKIVIPEGWRMEQIAERLYKRGVIKDKREFISIVKREDLEGYLFPSTYFFKKKSEARHIINMLKLEFEKNIRPLFKNGFPKGLDEKKVLVIASIVEREAVVSSERPLIAAVYLNRIKKRMRLEADPTVQYVLGYWKKGLTYKDLRTKSPYNTYVSRGIPPGPICNSGKESIHAVLHPAKINALYFVAERKDGKHVFNINFKEHLKAIKRIKAAAKKKKK